MHGGVSGTSGNMPFELPDGIVVTNYSNVNWSYTAEENFANWKQIGEGVLTIGAIVAIIVLIADDATGVGALDDPALVPLFQYVTSKLPALGDVIQELLPKFQQICPAY